VLAQRLQQRILLFPGPAGGTGGRIAGLRVGYPDRPFRTRRLSRAEQLVTGPRDASSLPRPPIQHFSRAPVSKRRTAPTPLKSKGREGLKDPPTLLKIQRLPVPPPPVYLLGFSRGAAWRDGTEPTEAERAEAQVAARELSGVCSPPCAVYGLRRIAPAVWEIQREVRDESGESSGNVCFAIHLDDFHARADGWFSGVAEVPCE
jgi:hypothetical protein